MTGCDLQLSEREDKENQNSDEDKSETKDPLHISQYILQQIPNSIKTRSPTIAVLKNNQTITSTNTSANKDELTYNKKKVTRGKTPIFPSNK